MIFAIDPGNEQSAYVLVADDYTPVLFGKIPNAELIEKLYNSDGYETEYVIEMVASYGMAVGKEVFDTCVWIGKFSEAITMGLHKPYTLMYRKEVKMNLCGQTKAKDSNIIQALKDRFGDKGTAKNKGFFYGFSKDVWQAYALACTYLDQSKIESEEK